MRDPLYVGPTRPSMLMGIPFEAWIAIALVTALPFIATSNFLVVLLAPPLYVAAWLICWSEPRGFELIMRWVDTKATSISRGHWGAPSRGPMTSRRQLRSKR